MAQMATGATVYLEGVEMNFVAKFNIAEGWVDCYTSSPSHYSNVDSVVGEYMTSRLYGKIEVVFN